MDWNAAKTEYITDGSMSYRKLSRKYGVSVTAICDRSKSEGWVALRERFLNDTFTETVKVVGDERVDRAARIVEIADKLLIKIEQAVDRAEDAKSLKAIAGALKEIQDIQGIKSDGDRREQEARIEKLRKDTQRSEGDDITEIEVTFSAGEDSWNE